MSHSKIIKHVFGVYGSVDMSAGWPVAVCSSNSGSDSYAHQSSRWVMDFTNDSEDTVMKLYFPSETFIFL